MKVLLSFFPKVLFVLFVVFILFISVRGLPGNPTPTQLNTAYWKENGPFELSPERGRYALLYSLVENHSFHLTPDIAKFTAPDVGYIKGHYVSIFAPSVSIVAIPGYLIGKYFASAQFGTFLWMALFALLNVLLIRAIAVKLGANAMAALIAGIVFLFATPAFAYAVTIYEHHLSTFFILLSIYLLIRFNNLLSLFIIWILYAFAFTVDYPNLFMMFPVALTAFFRSITLLHRQNKFTVSLSFPRLLTVLGVILPFIFLLWVNQMSYDNPFKLSGTVSRVLGVNENGTPILWDQYFSKHTQTVPNKDAAPQGTVLNFFLPRNMLNGLYILLLSPDRGVIMYAPVILFGVVGLYFTNKRKHTLTPVLLSIVSVNLILYSMWGDPYGGWAFGARYLIPSYAILAIYLALFLTYFGRRRFVIFFFFAVLCYSVAVNTVGALTSNSNPPKVEADSLSNITHKHESYTYMRNVSYLNSNISKSYIFQSYASSYFSAWQYYSYITFILLSVSGFLTIYFHVNMQKLFRKGEHNALE